MEKSTPPCLAQQMLRIVLLVFGGQILILYFLGWFFKNGLAVFGTFLESCDFVYFYNAARLWIAGGNPYLSSGFITPPPSLMFPALVAHLSLARATFLFLCLNLLVVPTTFWWYSGTLKLALRLRLLFAVAAFLFVSAQQSLRGGNLDGLMFALLMLAFGLRSRLAAPAALGISVVLKLYSVLFVPVALRHRQWRYAVVAMFSSLLCLLPFFHLWPAALHALATRNLRYAEISIAPATLLWNLTGELSGTSRLLCFFFWILTFGLALYRDHESRITPQTLGRYAPWMLSMPTLVFPYVGILALATLGTLLSTASRRPLRAAEYCAFTGFLLLGIHLEFASGRMPLLQTTYYAFRSHAAVVESLGVTLMMIGMSLAPNSIESSGGARHEATEEASLPGNTLPRRSRQEVPA